MLQREVPEYVNVLTAQLAREQGIPVFMVSPTLGLVLVTSSDAPCQPLLTTDLSSAVGRTWAGRTRLSTRR